MRGTYIKKVGIALLFLGLVGLASQAFAQPTEVLNGTNSTWKFWTNGDQGTFWRDTDFPDESWPTGRGLFGLETTAYGYPINTPWPALAVAANESFARTIYARALFNWNQGLEGVIFNGTLRIDDGIIMYLNGIEVFRFNMPAGPAVYSTRASAANPGGEPVIMPIEFSPATAGATLNAGVNLLAVEVHQAGDTSSDVVFALDLSGSQQVAPSITDPTQPLDLTLTEGVAFTLRVVATGVPAPTYQWFHDTGAGFATVPGATSSNYNVAVSDPTLHSGNYYCQVSNSAGSVNSRTNTVSVLDDTSGPLFLNGVVRSDGTLLLSFNEAMSDGTVPVPGGGGELVPGPDAFSIEIHSRDEVVVTLGGTATVNNGTNVLVTAASALDLNKTYYVVLYPNFCFDLFNNPFEGTAGEPLQANIQSQIFILRVDDAPIWKWDQSNVDQGLAVPPYYDPTFNDSTWGGPGPGLLGQETADLTRPVGGIPTLPELVMRTDLMAPNEGGPNTTYFRARFFLPVAVADMVAVQIRVVADDSPIVYLNGMEALRVRMPAGPVTIATQGTGGAVGDANYEGPFTISPSLFVDGENQIAVEVHQIGANSSDLVWGVEVVALVNDIIVAAPEIIVEPVQPPTLNEGDSLSLGVVATGTQPLTYRWQLNTGAGFQDISGATSTSYSVPSVTTANAGMYRVIVSNSIGSDTSLVVNVTVTPDLIAPSVIRAYAELNRSNIVIDVSEPVREQDGTNTATYAVSLRDGSGGNLTILDADLSNGGETITLTTSPRSENNYRLQIINLRDLSAAGNALNTTRNLYTEQVVVKADENSQWRYLDTGVDPGSTWPTAGFSDAAWLTGAPMFYNRTPTDGVHDIPIRSRVSLTNSAGARIVAYYFRTTVNYPHNPAVVEPAFRFILDDGSVAFVNGLEVLRVGMNPTATITNGSLANRTSGTDLSWEPSETINTGSFVNGNNLIAVEVHNVTLTSSDIGFALEVLGRFETITPIPAITSITIDGSGNVILTHDGGPGVFVQQTSALANPVSSTSWTTRPGGPHASPHNAGAATGTRIFRLSTTP